MENEVINTEPAAVAEASAEESCEDFSAEKAAETVEEGSTEDESPRESVEEARSVDYENLAALDLDTLRREFPELCEINHVSELDNPLRYAALRDLGLTPVEAYLATRKRGLTDTRSHLFGAVGRVCAAPSSSMSQGELSAARELFGDMSDADINKLYRKVTG